MTAHLKLVEPSNLNRRVAVRRPNAELRPREYLTVAEVERLMKAAKSGRYGHRDATLILVAFRHGLRAVEIAGLEWSQVEFGRNAALHVRRAKNGTRAMSATCWLPHASGASGAQRHYNHRERFMIRALTFVVALFAAAAAARTVACRAIDLADRGSRRRQRPEERRRGEEAEAEAQGPWRYRPEQRRRVRRHRAG